jgi:iron complex outermembrane recepter protein
MPSAAGSIKAVCVQPCCLRVRSARRRLARAVVTACAGLAAVGLSASAQSQPVGSQPVGSQPLAPQSVPPPPSAAVAPPGAPQTLETVMVKGQALRSSQAPFSATTFDTETIRARQVAQPQELFRWVPGMNVRNFGLGGVADAISLRGFSSGGHGGDIGIVIDGIPLNEAMSHADGYADLNVVIPLEIDSLTVFRGPVSPLFGNFNRGGLIVIDTRKSGAYRQGDFSVGSHRSGDVQAAYGGALGPSQQLNLAAQYHTTDGFRPQSDTWRATLAGRWSIQAAADLQLALSGRVHRGEGDSASYLTRAQFERDPYGIDPRVRNDGAEKTFDTLRADANYLIDPRLKLLSFVYGTQQDFTRWFTRPTGTNPAADWTQREETYERSVWGAGVNLNGQAPLTGGWLNWVAGLESFRESTDYLFFDGLNRRLRVNPAILDRRSTLDSVSAFGEVEAAPHPLFRPTVGLRYDRFNGECARNGPEIGTDPCGPLADTDHLSPKLGLRSDVLPQLQLRASWAEGFALASNFIKYASGAANLDNNVFRQTEVGGTARLGEALTADLAWYRTTSTDEVRTVAPGVFENFGATRRSGLEASLNWTPLADLTASLVWARADSEVTENANPALLGRQVTGVPERTATVGLSYAPAQGLGGSVTWRDVGRYAVNPANTIFYDGYSTLDLGLTYSGRWGASRWRASLRLDNALDETLATSVFVIGGQTLLASGAPRTLRAGVQLDL